MRILLQVSILQNSAITHLEDMTFDGMIWIWFYFY